MSLPSRHWAIFEALKNNQILVNGQVRVFDEWCHFWDQIEAADEHNKRVNRARRVAINRIRRLRPNQIDILVYQEESPDRIEELPDSPDSPEWWIHGPFRHLWAQEQPDSSSESSEEAEDFDQDAPDQYEDLNQALDALDQYDALVSDADSNNNNEETLCPLNTDCKNDDCTLLHF